MRNYPWQQLTSIGCATTEELRRIVTNKKYTSYYRQCAIQEHYHRGG